MALTVGTRLGHYDVTAFLGEGGMGQVWQATDTQLNRQDFRPTGNVGRMLTFAGSTGCSRKIGFLDHGLLDFSGQLYRLVPSVPANLRGTGGARLLREAMRDIHTDHVGSLLRPPELLDARAAFADGTIGSAELKAAEDRAIDHVVTLQEQAGCQIITDGELRRLSFQSQILESVDGFGEWDLEAFLWGDWYGAGLEPWHRRRPADLGVVAPLRRKRHLSAEEFTYLRGRTDRVTKVTLPSPSLLSSFWSPTRSREAYPTLPDFLQAVTEIRVS